MLGLQSISSSDLGSALTGHGIITVDESALGQIEAGADRVLEEVGIRFEDDRRRSTSGASTAVS